MKKLTVLILAGGSGTRFWPFETNKILFPFLGKPLADYSVKPHIPAHTDRVVIIANDDNYDYFSSQKYPCSHSVLKQQSSLGMADAILTAENEIKDSSLLILIADDYFEQTLSSSVLQYANTHDVFAVIPGWKTESYFPGGYLKLQDNKVQGIVEKPLPGTEPSEYINISCHFISDSNLLLQKIHTINSENDDVYELALSQLMNEHEFHMLPYEGTFTSLKYPWHVLSIMDLLLYGIKDYRGENIQVKDHVIIEGPVYIGNNVRILENTKIVGPVYIGDNSIIGNNNVIRHSYLGSDCVTGFNTDITRSYVGDNCWFHSNYIGDSILEKNISMGSGTVLANLRLDEGEIYSHIKGKKINTGRNKLGAIIGENVRIGVNTSIMPGIKIGANSMIGAGMTVSQDIPPESFVHAITTISIEKNSKSISTDREQFKKKI